MIKILKDNQGHILLQVIIFSSITVYFISSVTSLALSNLKLVNQTIESEKALQISEAGIEYYRWHLAHAPQDYQDGTATSGPYIHNFYDKNGNIIGRFFLDITPPLLGSTLVRVKSSGDILGGSLLKRSVVAQFAKPSIAKYAAVANDSIRFGEGTEVYGPIHSNHGVRFDGIAYNIITSSVSSYDDPDHGGADEFGVHTHIHPVDPLPPATIPRRFDVFKAGRQFPVPLVDFTGITADLVQMKNEAQQRGFYRGSAGALGYHIVLNSNNFSLYRVTGLINAPSGCTNSANQSGWGTWSIRNENFIGNYQYPQNGLIFLEDDIFINGQINRKRLNIIAAFLPDNPPFRKNIIINNDLLYTNYDGSDTIGLIAQGNIIVGMISEDDLQIDAALIAQNGRVGRYYYRPPGGGSQRCSPYHVRQKITLWGMIATKERYGFAYTDNTGYLIRSLNYDGNMLYSPPPNFPLTSDQYITIDWTEEY